MATEFTMPKLGLTMEEATIVEWLVADGCTIEAGTAVMRIETDKVETDVEIGVGGVLHHVGRPGDVFACGATIAYVLAPGEQPPSRAAPSVPAASTFAAATLPPPAPVTPPHDGGRHFSSPNARRIAAAAGVDVRTVTGSGPRGRVVGADVSAHTTAPGPNASPSEFAVASVAARQLADLLGVDLHAVPADPVEQRITRDGVAAYVRSRLASAPTPPASVTTAVTLLQTPSEMVPMSGMRGTIAKRMHASLHESAQLTLTMDAEMDAVLDDRRIRSERGAAPGFTDYVIAAAARALTRHPRVNSQVTADGIAVLPDVHVGLAVALDNGLMVPVVRHADRLTLDELSAETSRLAAAARAGRLAPAEVEGGTFSVSALGMFGVDAFTPVINPPNVAILGAGRLREEVVLVDGAVSTVTRLTLSLTWDHRVLDGAPAADFCRTIVQLFAQPDQLD
jgi:pyruvate dehydrogenase E2 component (dihydrolipoamide acetyltransferase)